MQTPMVLLLLSSSLLFAQSAQVLKVPHNTPAMVQHYGRGTPPFSPMTGMDNKPFQVVSTKGHWTLLYYWADWCIPCIQEGVPNLISFADAHRAQARNFQIIAIRFNSTDEAGDWDDFHTKTVRLEKTLWRAVPPFPVVYDSSTRMTTDWGVHELPTYALIDPKGNLVKDGNLVMLKARLESSR